VETGGCEVKGHRSHLLYVKATWDYLNPVSITKTTIHTERRRGKEGGREGGEGGRGGGREGGRERERERERENLKTKLVPSHSVFLSHYLSFMFTALHDIIYNVMSWTR
jgi:hypothetical protein